MAQKPSIDRLGPLSSRLASIQGLGISLHNNTAKSAAYTVAALAALYALNKTLSHLSMHNSLFSPWDDSKEIVLITGGAGGIGRPMADRFARRGTRVVIFDVVAPKDALLPGMTFYQVDISSPQEIHTVAERVRAEVGDPTVLINNAGIASGQTILDSKPEGLRRMFDVNVISHFWVVQEFLPAMIQKNAGHVVSMASLASFVVIVGIADYGCTKAAVLAFHEGLRQELRHVYNAPGVKTTIVHPSWVHTPMTSQFPAYKKLKSVAIDPDVVVDAVVCQVLNKRSGQIFRPWWGSLLAGLRGFPTWLQEGVRSSQVHLFLENNE